MWADCLTGGLFNRASRERICLTAAINRTRSSKKMAHCRATATGGAGINLKATTLSAAKAEAADWASYGNTITLWADGDPVADYPFEQGGCNGDGTRNFTLGPWTTA
jgi:hypothetical protein